MNKKKKILYLVTGPSGTGKNTITAKVLKNKLTSSTTRGIRENEVNGIDYNFINREDFTKDKFVEFTEYLGNTYGLEVSEFNKVFEYGTAYFICEVNGMLRVKQYVEEHNLQDEIELVTIFIYTSRGAIERQLWKRNTPLEIFKERIGNYENEMKDMDLYDYALLNHYGEPHLIVKELRSIVEKHENNSVDASL